MDYMNPQCRYEEATANLKWMSGMSIRRAENHACVDNDTITKRGAAKVSSNHHESVSR